jgi:PAS domain S-box-containing protein
MDPSLAQKIWVLYLQAEGLNGLLLLLVCGTLYSHRRRTYFLYWTLAWLAFVLWRLLNGLAVGESWLGAAAVDGKGTALSCLAAVCGWWHVGLWVFGLLHLRHVYQTSAAPAGEAAPPPPPMLDMRVTLRCLAAMTALAVLVQALWPHAAQRVLATMMAVVYGGSAVWFAAWWWRTGLLGALMLPVSLGLCALARLYSTRLVLDPAAGAIPLSVLYYNALLDFLLQTFTVVAMIVVLLGDENVLLRETSRRLAESEDRFRLLFEHSGVGMALLSSEGDFLQANPALVQMLGYPVEELLGRHVTDLMYAEDRSSGGGDHLRDKVNEPQYEKEKRFLHRSGRLVWSRLMRVPIRDSQGAIRYHATIFIDVTERKHVEEALATSENRLRLRFQQAFDGICLWSSAGTFLDANPALCRLLGMSREELLGRDVAEMAVDAEVVRHHLRAVLESSGNHCETRLLSRGGSPVDVEVNSAVIEVEEQRLILGICRDISARKRAEAALRQVQTALRAERDFIARILQTAEALIVVLDAEGRILRFNDKCQSVSGRREEEVQGRLFWELLLPERVVAKVRGRFQQLLAGADPAETYENPWCNRDGGERLIAWRCSLIRDEGGKPRHIIAVGLDVTEQRQLEEQVIHARKMETLGTLVGGIAHDFNNQLTAILGNLDMARSDLDQLRSPQGPARISRQPALDDVVPCVQDAERAAQRCARMTARLLTFSRGRVGAMRPLALDQLVGETATALQRELPDIKVEVSAPPDLSPVTADVAQVQELLLNLTANACDAMPNGGTLTLTLANRTFATEDCAANLDARPGSFVELCVRDTGRGMTPEVRERVFEPFFTTKRPGQGAGMGLSVAFGIVKGHKGWITVQSELGAGTSFRIYLPVAPAQLQPTAPPALPVPAQVVGGRILVVDDERVVRNLARTVLERVGFQVLTADSGEKALSIYRREGSAIDLVLLDYSMPRMNGVQALKELARLDPDVCVIFCSGYHTDDQVDQMLAAGARAFVPKPYRPRDIVQAIRRVLAQKRITPKTER